MFTYDLPFLIVLKAVWQKSRALIFAINTSVVLQ
jgi:hypothetical protein